MLFPIYSTTLSLSLLKRLKTFGLKIQHQGMCNWESYYFRKTSLHQEEVRPQNKVLDFGYWLYRFHSVSQSWPLLETGVVKGFRLCRAGILRFCNIVVTKIFSWMIMSIYYFYNLRFDSDNCGSTVEGRPLAASPPRGLLVDVLWILHVVSIAAQDQDRLTEFW